ncbi:hypothetical protein P7L75_04650 (plasmid) [Tistrella mobilis]|uniref:hypothetical protein n=1 Tax=Tistrella mobilis TaxID=171437 RepID=UPI003555DB40
MTDLAAIGDLQIETFPPAPLETSETRRVVLHFRLPVETPAQLVGARLPLCLLRLCDLPRQARPGPGSVGPGSISP